MALWAPAQNLSVVFSANGSEARMRGMWRRRDSVVVRTASSEVSSSGGGEMAAYEEGQLERPNWAGETPLSRLVGAIISFKPLYSVLKLGARQVLIRNMDWNSTAEKTNIPWREMTNEILESDVYKEMESIENPSVVYPDYYLNPFHAYDEGNLHGCAKAAAEAEAATMSMGLDLSPYFLAVAQFKEKERASRKNLINWVHANGEDSGLPSKSFDIASMLMCIEENEFFRDAPELHECPARAIVGLVREAFRLLRPGGTIALTDNSPKSKVLQELSPVLFTLMKSTEPFLDEYYLTDLEGRMREAGFVNVTTV
ncbi:hypothetical protein CK203_015474 [Vitis vinifera]|uniref:Methyltransferase type 11 domain-containing protein n=1 Tax=Vitis vinifera TaxID=29760 RepID=A0A438JKI7_VITVI|nr:hypothetical protein CK203_015474 [Vitis vinifera]